MWLSGPHGQYGIGHTMCGCLDLMDSTVSDTPGVAGWYMGHARCGWLDVPCSTVSDIPGVVGWTSDCIVSDTPGVAGWTSRTL